MQKIDMHYLAQKYRPDRDGYAVPNGKSHLVKMSKTFCGLSIRNMNLPRGDTQLSRWLIDLITCQKCKKIAENRIK
jgi:hypothetical protein